MSFIVLSYIVLFKNRFSFMDVVFCLMFVVYVGIGFMFFYEMRLEGLYYILYVFLIVWFIDIGVYLFGKMMGKYKFWLVISLNKIIEGFIGGLFCSLIVLFVMLYFVDFNMNVWILFGVILILSLFG